MVDALDDPENIERKGFTMRRSTAHRIAMGLVCLLLWPLSIAAYTDWRIGQAQEWLKAAGFDPGYIDGVLGPRTREALRRFQASQGLPVTGTLDEATRRRLAQKEAPQIPPESDQSTWTKAPPGGDYKKLSAIAQLPDYLPGLGTLYVNPATLPAGPFLAYDRNGNLVSSIYMIPLKDLRSGQAFNKLATAKLKADHVDIYYNNGHAGVPEPHYHFVLWYIPPEQVEALK